MKVGYVRCSTAEQNEARQLKMVEEQKAKKLFIYKVSGKSTDRPAYKEMMAFVRTGDTVITVIVESISRISRNTRDLLISELTDRQVEFVELERESILERQREGIEIAKAVGKYKGRQPVAVNEKRLRTICARWRVGEITATAAMAELGIKPNTFYRRVKEYEL